MTRTYAKVTDEKRQMLIELIQKSMTIKDAAKRVDIKYENAKAIYRVYRKEQRTDKRRNRFRYKVTVGGPTLNEAPLQSKGSGSRKQRNVAKYRMGSGASGRGAKQEDDDDYDMEDFSEKESQDNGQSSNNYQSSQCVAMAVADKIKYDGSKMMLEKRKVSMKQNKSLKCPKMSGIIEKMPITQPMQHQTPVGVKRNPSYNQLGDATVNIEFKNMAPFSEQTSQFLHAKNLTIQGVVKDVYEMPLEPITYGASFFERLKQHAGPITKSMLKQEAGWLTVTTPNQALLLESNSMRPPAQLLEQAMEQQAANTTKNQQMTINEEEYNHGAARRIPSNDPPASDQNFQLQGQNSGKESQNRKNAHLQKAQLMKLPMEVTHQSQSRTQPQYKMQPNSPDTLAQNRLSNNLTQISQTGGGGAAAATGVHQHDQHRLSSNSLAANQSGNNFGGLKLHSATLSGNNEQGGVTNQFLSPHRQRTQSGNYIYGGTASAMQQQQAAPSSQEIQTMYQQNSQQHLNKSNFGGGSGSSVLKKQQISMHNSGHLPFQYGGAGVQGNNNGSSVNTKLSQDMASFRFQNSSSAAAIDISANSKMNQRVAGGGRRFSIYNTSGGSQIENQQMIQHQMQFPQPQTLYPPNYNISNQIAFNQRGCSDQQQIDSNILSSMQHISNVIQSQQNIRKLTNQSLGEAFEEEKFHNNSHQHQQLQHQHQQAQPSDGSHHQLQQLQSSSHHLHQNQPAQPVMVAAAAQQQQMQPNIQNPHHSQLQQQQQQQQLPQQQQMQHQYSHAVEGSPNIMPLMQQQQQTMTGNGAGVIYATRSRISEMFKMPDMQQRSSGEQHHQSSRVAAPSSLPYNSGRESDNFMSHLVGQQAASAPQDGSASTTTEPQMNMLIGHGQQEPQNRISVLQNNLNYVFDNSAAPNGGQIVGHCGKEDYNSNPQQQQRVQQAMAVGENKLSHSCLTSVVSLLGENQQFQPTAANIAAQEQVKQRMLAKSAHQKRQLSGDQQENLSKISENQRLSQKSSGMLQLNQSQNSVVSNATIEQRQSGKMESFTSGPRIPYVGAQQLALKQKQLSLRHVQPQAISESAKGNLDKITMNTCTVAPGTEDQAQAAANTKNRRFASPKEAMAHSQLLNHNSNQILVTENQLGVIEDGGVSHAIPPQLVRSGPNIDNLGQLYSGTAVQKQQQMAQPPCLPDSSVFTWHFSENVANQTTPQEQQVTGPVSHQLTVSGGGAHQQHVEKGKLQNYRENRPAIVTQNSLIQPIPKTLPSKQDKNSSKTMAVPNRSNLIQKMQVSTSDHNNTNLRASGAALGPLAYHVSPPQISDKGPATQNRPLSDVAYVKNTNAKMSTLLIKFNNDSNKQLTNEDDIMLDALQHSSSRSSSSDSISAASDEHQNKLDEPQQLQAKQPIVPKGEQQPSKQQEINTSPAVLQNIREGQANQIQQNSSTNVNLTIPRMSQVLSGQLSKNHDQVKANPMSQQLHQVGAEQQPHSSVNNFQMAQQPQQPYLQSQQTMQQAPMTQRVPSQIPQSAQQNLPMRTTLPLSQQPQAPSNKNSEVTRYLMNQLEIIHLKMKSLGYSQDNIWAAPQAPSQEPVSLQQAFTTIDNFSVEIFALHKYIDESKSENTKAKEVLSHTTQLLQSFQSVIKLFWNEMRGF